MILTMHRVTAGRRGTVTGADTNADDGQAQEKRTAPARGIANVTLPLKEYTHYNIIKNSYPCTFACIN